MTADVSIVIPSLNSPMIDRVISSVLAQTPKDAVKHVIVVGRDEPGLIHPVERLTFIDTGKPVSAGTARNLGIQATTSRLLLFIDSDCIPDENWLREHLAAHAEGHQVVGGGVLPTGRNYWHCAYNLSLFNKTLTTSPEGERDILPTLNLSVSRAVIDKVGLMRGELLRGQDFDWIQRMRRHGFKPFLWPQAVVSHEHNRHDFRTLWRDFVRSGYFGRSIRLEHQELLNTPRILESRLAVRLLSPVIAGWTLREMAKNHPHFFSMYWKYLPAVYLSKVAWCWGAGMKEAPPHPANAPMNNR